MTERWRKPVIAVAVDEDPEHVIITQDGRTRRSINITVSPEDMERIRQGYVCAWCYSVHETPFPENCRACRQQMREKQPEFVAVSYRGEVRLPPVHDHDEEQAYVDEWLEARELERKGYSKQGQIIVPRGL